MSRQLKHILGAMVILLTLGVGYVAKFGLYPQFFDIAWDEEVQLHDGRVIVVHVTRTFERTSLIYRWRALDRDTSISFDSNSSLGRIVRVFKNYDVNLIDELDGNWYFGLSVTTGIPPQKLVDAAYPVLILQKDGREKMASSWVDIPDFPRQNVMPVTPSPEGISKFAGSLLTWQTKMNHWNHNQRAAGDNGAIIQRNTFNLEQSK
jgi:hypothetical protein